MRYAPLVEMADNVLKYKYIVKNVARRAGKTATFMPKPIFLDNGSECTSIPRYGATATIFSPVLDTPACLRRGCTLSADSSVTPPLCALHQLDDQ